MFTLVNQYLLSPDFQLWISDSLKSKASIRFSAPNFKYVVAGVRTLPLSSRIFPKLQLFPIKRITELPVPESPTTQKR